MEQLTFELQKIEDDPEYLLDVWIEASNGDYSAATRQMLAPMDLNQFGEALQNFPKSIHHSVSLEVVLESRKRFRIGRTRIVCAEDLQRQGKSSPVADLAHTELLIRACMVGPGDCAIEVKSNNLADPPHLADAHFFIECEAAAVNRLGTSFCSGVQKLAPMQEGECLDVALSTKR